MVSARLVRFATPSHILALGRSLLVWALAPALLLYVFVFAYPIVRFTTFGLASGLSHLPSFADLVSGRSLLGRLLLMSIALGGCTTLVTLLIGYPVAYYLARSRSRYRHYVFVAIFVPLLFSIVIRTFGWIVLLGSNGLVNMVLVATGVTDRPITWLYNFPMTVVGLVHVFLPFMILSILSALARIDFRTEEAATILGAGPWRVFRHITLPLSAQGIFSGCAIVFSLSMGSYVTPRLLGGGRVQVLATEIYSQMLEIGDWGMAALLGLVLTIVTLAVIGVHQAFITRRALASR
jgi:putative spermidine/putrescine transport system permease protein